ncbi:MAG: hypothetical protein XXXNARYT_001592 [Candidatus Accumulibacter regalis]|jgi:hypothetical protein
MFQQPRLMVVLSVVLPARGKLVLFLLLLAPFQLCFAGAMAFKEGVKGLQSGPLLLPCRLPRGRVRLLPADRLQLLADGLVEPAQEFLIVAPFGLPQSLLHGSAKALAVVIAILFEHVELALRIAFRGNQARQTLRRFVAAILHQVENGLQGEWFRHVGLGERGWLIQRRVGVGSMADYPQSGVDGEQGLQICDAGVEVGALGEILLQQYFECWIDGDGLVELQVGAGSVGADADQVAGALVA